MYCANKPALAVFLLLGISSLHVESIDLDNAMRPSAVAPHSHSLSILATYSVYRFSNDDGILADYVRLTELLMEVGPNLRMPHSRAMGDGLFELRPRGREGIGRVLYCYIDGQRIVILHAFIKKTQETPEKNYALPGTE